MAADAPARPATPGAADGTIRWHVAIYGGRIELAEAPAPPPDLCFTTDYATAAAIARVT